MRSRRLTEEPAPRTARALLAALLCLATLATSAPAALAATPPTAEPPDARFVVGSALGAVKVPVRVAWPEASAGTAAVASYELEYQRDDDGIWRPITLPSALSLSVTVMLRPGTLNQFRVRAQDTAGRLGDWAYGPQLWLALVHEYELEVSLSASWRSKSTTSAYGGALAFSRNAGAEAGFDFTATRVAWVAARGPRQGRADLSIDGGSRPTIDLFAAEAQPRRIVFEDSWADAQERHLSIEVEGTLDRPRVSVDAFVTLGPPPTSVLVGAGDIATCGGKGDEKTALVVDAIDGTVFTAGDNAYPDGTESDFANCYNPSWGRFRGRTRPSPGNHDYVATRTADGYHGYFGRQVAPAARPWYAYDAGTWRAYALNSNCWAVGGCGTESAQYAWLKHDLEANPRRCVVAYWHHPRFSSGYHGPSKSMAQIVELLYDMGAELVIAGHDHSYERFAPMTPTGTADPSRGIRHFVVGTGGAGLYPPGTLMDNSEVLHTETKGVLKLTLSWSRYEWQFVPVAGRTFSDSGSASCH